MSRAKLNIKSASSIPWICAPGSLPPWPGSITTRSFLFWDCLTAGVAEWEIGAASSNFIGLEIASNSF